MMTTNRYLMMALSIVCCSLVSGQRMAQFRHLTTADGLPDNGISALYVDSRGLLWIGTDAGLARYDGYEVVSFLEYTDSNGHSGPITGVYHISEEETTGNLLLNVGMFPMRYDRHAHRVVSLGKEKISWTQATDFTSQDGTLWRYYYDNDRLDYRAKGAAVWQSLQLSGMDNGTLKNAVRGLADDGSGGLWIATDHSGIYHYTVHGDLKSSTLTNRRKQSLDPWDLPSDNINCLTADHQGTIWVGDYKRGVSFWNPSFDMLTVQSVECGDVSALLIDSRRILWIGTDGNGLFREGKGERAQKTAMPNVVVTSIKEDAWGRVWVGTYGDGLYKIENSKIEKLESVGNRKVSSLAIDGDGQVWITSAFDPLLCYNPKTGNCRKVLNDAGYDIKGLSATVDAEGRVLVGSYYGIYRINPKTGQQDVLYGAGGREFMNMQATSLLMDSRGTLWMGHDNGLTAWDTKTDSVRWFTAEHGGLTPGRVRSLMEDAHGRVMVVTAGGLTMVQRDKGGQYQVKASRFVDMSVSYVLNPNVTTLLPEGNPIFGTTNGYAVLNHVLLDSLGQTNVHVDFSEISASGGLADETASVLRLRHDDYNIVFKLYTNRLFDARQAQYSYRLQGLQDKWITTSEHTLNFASLPAGTYTLQVKARIGSGPWSEVRSMRIEVSPSLWASFPMRVVYVLLLCALLAGFFLYYKRRQQQRMEQQRHDMEQENLVRLADAKLRFFTNVSHDLRTPLTLIISPLQTLMKDPLAESVRKRLAVIDKNAHALQEQINTLLDFRKLDVNADALSLRPDDYVAFISSKVDSFRPYAEERHIRLDFISDERMLYTQFDAEKIHKTMYNLLSNAFKFTCTDGRIEVHLYRDGGQVCVSVADNGQGVPDGDKERIFDRFYQARQGDDTKTGSGIGLHIVSEYVRMHQGRVWVSDNSPCGAVFTFAIPLVGEETPTAVTDEKIARTEDDSQYTILVVEDNHDMSDFIRDALTADYRVLAAFDGREALEVISRERVNLVISDVMMPRMSGLELCAHIKKDLSTSHIPVLLLTAKTAEASVIEGLQIGADDYLTKPFNVDVLRLRIEKFIEWTRRAHRQFQQKIDIEPSEITITPLDEQFISKAIKTVEEHLLDSDFSVEMLGSEMGMNRVTLWKKIQSLTGKGPADFIRTIRLKRGRQLLDKSQMQVSEIAYAVGYNTVKRFTENFKQEYGMTPTEYRKRQDQQQSDSQ